MPIYAEKNAICELFADIYVKDTAICEICGIYVAITYHTELTCYQVRLKREVNMAQSRAA